MTIAALSFFWLLSVFGLLLGIFVSSEAGAALALLMAILGMLFLFTAAKRAMHPRMPAFSKLEFGWMLYVCALLIATLLANANLGFLDFGMQMRTFLALIAWSVWLFLLPVFIRTPQQLHGAIRAFDLFGLLVSASVFMPILFGIGEAQGPGGTVARVFGPFGDPVPFAITLFACRALIAGRWLALSVHLAALLMTVGLGAMLTFSVALCAHWLLPWKERALRRKRSGSRILFAVLAAPVMLAVLFLMVPRILARLFDPVLMATTFGSRVGSFRVALEIIQDYPLMGVGFNGFRAVAEHIGAQSLFTDVNFHENYIVQANNQVLQTLCDGGVVALASLLIFGYFFYKRLSWAANYGPVDRPAFRGFQIWFLGIAIGNQSAVWLMPFMIQSVALFIIAGLALAAARLPETGAAQVIAASGG